MTVQDIMTRFPTTLGVDDSITKAAQIMRDEDIGVIPVVDADGGPVGIVTDRDIVVKSIAEGHDVDSPVAECMTPHPDTIPHDITVEQATRQMAKHQVRRLPVVQNGRLIGILSLGDIAGSAAPTQAKAGILADVSTDDRALRTDTP